MAAQTGLALENGRLTAAVAAEVAARAKQTRDIEIARDVQQRLFPQEYPPIPGLDYAGGCRAALGVGGDYYDFIVLSPTHLGIAIGDVSGKGIPASLLMASLRAYLRGAQTIHRQADLTEVMRNLNKLVYESSDANRYATFFYGELDLDVADADLRECRAQSADAVPADATGGGDVLRLDAGGPVIGLMEECVYQQAYGDARRRRRARRVHRRRQRGDERGGRRVGRRSPDGRRPAAPRRAARARSSIA